MKQDGFFLPNPRTRLLTLCFSVLFAVLLLVSATVGKHQNLLPHAGSLFADETGVPHFLFWQLWLPRALVAAGVGAALAVSGCFFQLLSRNPLGSPDIIGINAGASLGAVAVSLVWVNTLPVTLGALIGAVATLVLVLLGNGTRNRFSLEIVIGGLAVNALAMAAVQFVLTSVRQEDAYLISVWLSGSLAQRGWGEVAVVWTTLPVCATALALLGRPFAVMQVNPAAAAFLGVPLKKISFWGLLAATILATAAVVAAGPIAFIALAAPHLTRKIFKSSRPLILPTALVGASLLLFSDLLARFLPMQSALPVGVFTAGVGGLYLLYLIFSERK